MILLFVNIFILIVFAAFIIKVFNVDKKLKEKSSPDPSWFGLIKKIILYIPCALIDLLEYIKLQYKITPKVAWQLLGLEILLVMGRFIIPYLYDKAMNRKGTLLVAKPQNINNEVFLENFEDLNYYKSDDVDKDASKDEMPTYQRLLVPSRLKGITSFIDGAEGARFCVHLAESLGKDFAFKLAV